MKRTTVLGWRPWFVLMVMAATAACHAMAPGIAAAQSCESSAVPTCGGTCPIGYTCTLTGDPIEPGGLSCECEESTPACGCDLEAPPGDVERLLSSVLNGQRSAYVSDPLTRGSDAKTLDKVGHDFRKIGVVSYKASGALYEGGGTDDVKLIAKAGKLYAKVQTKTDKLASRVLDAAGKSPPLIDAATRDIFLGWLEIVAYDLTPLLSPCPNGPCPPPPLCHNVTSPGCGGTCPAGKTCQTAGLNDPSLHCYCK